MKRLIAAGAAATLVGGLTVVATGLGASAAQAGGRQDIGPIPVPTMVCVQYTYKSQPYYLCLNYPQLPSL